MFLVETSDIKKPEDDSLGGSKKVFSSAKYRPFLFSLLLSLSSLFSDNLKIMFWENLFSYLLRLDKHYLEY